MPFYLTPKQDDSNQELQICIAEALTDTLTTVGRLARAVGMWSMFVQYSSLRAVRRLVWLSRPTH